MAGLNGSKLYLSPKETAALLEITTATLYRWRRKNGKGPPWKRHGGKIRYLRSDIERWDSASTHL